MATASPRLSIAQPPRNAVANGVLPSPAPRTQASSQKKPGNGTSGAGRVAGPRLKVVVRRLPPGLSQIELEQFLGEDWNLGAGRVDWMVFKPGKISQDPAKASRPARAYFHLTDHLHLSALAVKVRQVPLHDAKNSWTNAALLGPPSVEFAPYGRIPSSKSRHDSRQGTIDQDPDFIAFLESLTNPVAAKSTLADVSTEASDRKSEKITVTPLVQFLKDRKGNRNKDSSSPAKISKTGRAEGRDGRADRGIDKNSPAKGSKATSPEQRKAAKTDKVPRETIKVLKKEPSSAASGPKPSSASNTAKPPSKPASGPPAERRRERGNASAAARILQRDLGLGGSPNDRRGASKKDAVDAQKPGNKSANVSKVGQTPASTGAKDRQHASTPNKAAITSSAQAQKEDSTGTNGPPTILKKAAGVAKPLTGSGPSQASAASGPAVSPVTENPPTTAIPPNQKGSSTSTAAFLKHANPSQGVTEPLLRTAMEVFGPVVKVEIDKRKGFAYVDFKEPADLRKAIQGSPVKVAEGRVVVLERKERASGGAAAGSTPSRGPSKDRGRGGSSGGRGRGRGGGT